MLFGYTQDYVGQLCRSEKVDARRIGRTWYVCEKSILEHKKIYGVSEKKGLETTFSEEVKKLPVSGEKEIQPLKSTIPKIGFGKIDESVIPIIRELPDISEFQYEKEAAPFLPKIGRADFALPKKKISPFFQKSLSFVLAVLLVVGGYANRDEIIVNAARGFRAAQRELVSAVQILKNSTRLRLADFRKAKPFGFKPESIFDQQPKLSWIDSRISAEQVAATFGSTGFVDGGKLVQAVSGAVKLASFDYFENFVATKFEAKTNKFFASEKLFALVEKVLPDKQRVALESVAETTYEKLNPFLQKTSRFFVSLFGKKFVTNLAVETDGHPVSTGLQITQNKPSTGGQTVVLSPRNVIEEVTKNISYVGVSREEFEKRLATLAGNVFGQLATLSTATASNNTYINNVYNTVAGSNNIDMLHKVTISDSSIFTGGTVTGSTITDSPISGSTGSFTTLSASSDTSLATTTISKDLAVDTNTLYVDSTNNRVGIGTSSPTDTLALNGPAYFSQISAPSITTDRLYNTGGDLYFAGNLIGSASIGNWTTSGGNVYRASGNVGIGTSSPYAKLSVVGETVAQYFTATSTTATSTFTNLKASVFVQGAVQIVHKDGSATFYHPSANTDLARGTALNSAVAAAVSGDVIVVGAGTYQIAESGVDASITLPDNVSLIGQGRTATNIYAYSLGGGPNVYVGNNSTVENLKIQDDGGDGLGISGKTGVRIVNVEVVAGVTGAGLLVDGSASAKIFNSRFSGPLYGVTITSGSPDLEFYNSEIDDSTGTPGISKALKVTGGTVKIFGGRIDGTEARFGVTGGTLNVTEVGYTNGGALLGIGSANVGIGTTTPFAKLSVFGAGVATTTFALTGYYNQTAPLFRVSSTTGSATSTAFVIDSQGRVGVGTSTPGTDFAVQGGLLASG
ncbi:MAG: hypothetical protein UW71_C0009G0015, partial [Parcubacteria group bacterium GW2011_GWB1_44_7]